MRIRWTPAADLQDIADYLQQRHPNYRQATVRKLCQLIQGFKNFPLQGRVGREPGTRELSFSPLPYVAV